MARKAVSQSFTLRNILGWLLMSPALVLAPAVAFAEDEAADEVSAGNYHSCMVTSCGDVRCWGRNDWGQAEDRTDQYYVDVGVGQYHTCALDNTGGITCWGGYSVGQLQVPHGTFDALDVGANHACAIRDNGSIACWGANDFGQLNSPPILARDVSAGAYHSCAVTQDESQVVCWGRDTHGQSRVNQPILASILPSGESWRKVSAGGLHSCAISSDEYLHCWGYDGYKAVTGDNPSLSGQQPWPTEMSNAPGIYRFPVRKFLGVEAGLWGTCAVFRDRTLGDPSQDDTFCWGWPFYYGGAYSPPGTPPEAVAVGASHACMTTQGGQVECWGSNSFGKATPPVLAGGQCLLKLFFPWPEAQPLPWWTY